MENVVNAPSPVEGEVKFLKRRCLKLFQESCKQGVLVANKKYGITIIANGTNIYLASTQDIIHKDEEDIKLLNMKLEHPANKIALSCDDELLAVTANSVIYVYYMKGFENKASFVHKVSIPLKSPGICSGLQWNPCDPSSLAACYTDGTLTICTIKEKVDVKTVQANASVICWSPKGKQIVAGGRDKLTQYSPALAAVSSFTLPGTEANNPPELLSLIWLSTYQFIVVIRNAMEQDAQPCVMLVNKPKQGAVSGMFYYDICFSSSKKNRWHYLTAHIKEWNLIVAASSNAIELGTMKMDQNNWQHILQDDEWRAELPLKNKTEESYPVDMCLDMADVDADIPTDPDEKPSEPMPHVLILTDAGSLVVYKLITEMQPNVCVRTQAFKLCPTLKLTSLCEPNNNTENKVQESQKVLIPEPIKEPTPTVNQVTVPKVQSKPASVPQKVEAVPPNVTSLPTKQLPTPEDIVLKNKKAAKQAAEVKRTLIFNLVQQFDLVVKNLRARPKLELKQDTAKKTSERLKNLTKDLPDVGAQRHELLHLNLEHVKHLGTVSQAQTNLSTPDTEFDTDLYAFHDTESLKNTFAKVIREIDNSDRELKLRVTPSNAKRMTQPALEPIHGALVNMQRAIPSRFAKLTKLRDQVAQEHTTKEFDVVKNKNFENLSRTMRSLSLIPTKVTPHVAELSFASYKHYDKIQSNMPIISESEARDFAKETPRLLTTNIFNDTNQPQTDVSSSQERASVTPSGFMDRLAQKTQSAQPTGESGFISFSASKPSKPAYTFPLDSDYQNSPSLKDLLTAKSMAPVRAAEVPKSESAFAFSPTSKIETAFGQQPTSAKSPAEISKQLPLFSQNTTKEVTSGSPAFSFFKPNTTSPADSAPKPASIFSMPKSEPIIQKPVTIESAAPKPIEPVISKPVVTKTVEQAKPITTTPVSPKPVAQPVAAQPVAAKPVAVEESSLEKEADATTVFTFKLPSQTKSGHPQNTIFTTTEPIPAPEIPAAVTIKKVEPKEPAVEDTLKLKNDPEIGTPAVIPSSIEAIDLRAAESKFTVPEPTPPAIETQQKEDASVDEEFVELDMTSSLSITQNADTKTPDINGLLNSPICGISGGQSPSVFATPMKDSTNIFGGAAQSPSSIFGSAVAQQQSPGSIFGGANVSPQSTGSIFGGSSSPVGGSIFGGSQPSSASIFGGGASFSKFGAPTASATPPQTGGFGSTFGAQASSGSIFGSPGFGQPAQAPSPAASPQSIFGSANKSVFGAPAGFGSSSAFGAKASFGGSPTFGSGAFGSFGSSPGAASPGGTFSGFQSSQTSIFGNSSPTAPAFAATNQGNATFEALATQNTMTFGNLAQQSPVQNVQQPPAFNTSPSFSGWRG